MMHRINILVLIGVTNYRQKWFRKTFRNNKVGPTLAMRGRSGWPTRWRDVKPAAKPNVAPTSPAYVAPTVLTTLGQRLFDGAVLQGNVFCEC